MNKQQRHKALRLILWDSSVQADAIEDLLAGKIERAGPFTRQSLIVRMLTGMPWYKIIQLVPPEKVYEMLTDEVIGSLWPKSVRDQYRYVRQRLQEALQNSG